MARDRWDSRTAFVLASIGSAIGLGNIWRFPYVCYEYGGGAFLIAYLFALFTVGIPLLVLEFNLGHKTESAAPRAFKKVHKRLEFFGWLAIGIAFVIVTYYAVVMAWCFYYGVSAVTLAWGEDPSGFFYGEVLKLTDGPLDFGGANPLVFVALLAAWVSIVLAIWKGAKTVGKVVYITVLLPWLLLIIFVVKGVTLPGAVAGLNYYLTPDFGKLLDPEVWLAAYTQVFFSLSLGFGIMIAYASFLPRKADITNNAFLIGLADAATAFIGGLAVFGALGFHAHEIGQDTDLWISEITNQDRVAKVRVVASTETPGQYEGYLVPEGGLTEEEAARMEENPDLLLERDVLDATTLVTALTNPEDEVFGHLRGLLDEATRAAVDAVHAGEAPDAAVLTALLADVNRVMRESQVQAEAIDPAPEGAALIAHNRGVLAGEILARSLPAEAAEGLAKKVVAFPGAVTFHVVAALPEAVAGKENTAIPVENVVKSGPGLAFVTYPTIINELPVAPQLFGVLFFLMLLTLAVDSAFSLVEAAAASLRDKWGWSHTRSNLTIASIGFVLGIPFALGFGLYWLDIVDRFMNNFGLTSVCLGECIFLGWAIKSSRHRPLDQKRCSKLALAWGVGSFVVSTAVFSLIAGLLGGSFAERIPVIVIGADAVALLVLLVIYTSDHRYVEDLRQYANEQSDFRIGRWWNFLVRYVAPIILVSLIVLELRARIDAPYEGYPRLAEFLGGWLLLHVLVGLSFLLMFRRAKGGDE